MLFKNNTFFSAKRIIILFFFLSIKFFGQYRIEGQVIDEKTKEPLAFVSIVIKGTQKGGSSSIEGKFKLSSDQPIREIVLSYVGYEPLTYVINGSQQVLIKLKRQAVELSEVKILPGENPAHRIIKLASKNRDKNNPDKIHSYICNTYNKTHYELVPNITDPDSIKKDSSLARVVKFSTKSNILMMESVTERKYLSPNNLNETVLANKVSGFKNPSFTTLATDLQPFNFYGDYFNMLGKDYLNPITSGSTTKYFFQIEDTLYQNNDSIYIISFRPLKGKNFEGLKGVLYINTNKYAIQNVIAEPYDKTLMHLKIQQQYQYVDGKQWFPEQLNYELHFENYPSKKLGMRLIGKSFITNVQLDTSLRNRDFSYTTVTTDTYANSKDSVYWLTHRLDTLSLKEKSTYQFIDSIGKKAKLDQKLKMVEALTTGKLPISFVSLDLNKIILVNNYETFRAGLGLHTNNKLSRWFTIGGYAGYGYTDKEIKYGFDGKVFFKKNSKDYFLKYAYSHDLAEAAKPFYFQTRNNYYRNTLVSRMDFVTQHAATFNFRCFKHLTSDINYTQSEIKPTYPYNYLSSVTDYTVPTSSDTIASANFNLKNVEVGIKGRFAYKERLVQSLGQVISGGSKYPIIYFSYGKGLKIKDLGAYDYNKYTLGIEKTFLIRNVGKTHVLLESGMIDQKVPYPLLFNGSGSIFKNRIYIENAFQTMGFNEFVSDSYANLFLSHNFGSLLFKTEKIKPEIILHTNIGYGSLSNINQHQFLPFKTMEKGFFESGLMINNIVKFKYMNLVYIGFGGGAFIRYGDYANPSLKDNIAFKVSMSLTF